MALYAAVMTAFFVDQATQTPVVVQCAQAAPESWVKWLLPTIVQTVVSLVSIAAGVSIAIWSFRKNRESEQKQWNRNQEAAHAQWIRDQKKAEWGQLLRSVAEVHRVLRAVSTTGKERAELIAEGLKPAVHELLISQTNCILLWVFFADPVRGKRFFSFLEEADIISGKISGLLSLIREPLEGSSAKEQTGQLTDLQTLTREITNKYFDFQQWLRQEAASDLA